MARKERPHNERCGGVDDSMAAGTMFRFWGLEQNLSQVESQTDASAFCSASQTPCKTQIGGCRT